MLAPWWQTFRDTVILTLEHSRITMTLFGLVFALLGAGLIAALFMRFQSRPYYIRSGAYSVGIDEQVIQNTLQAYCQERFAGYTVQTEARVRSQKLSISMHLPKSPKENHKSLLNQLEKELKDILANVFGYRKRFVLIISFED